MNVAKNWAPTITLIALTSEEQMIIPVKKTLNNAGHTNAKIESILAKFGKKNAAKSAVFLLIVSLRSFLLKFPVKSANFF